MLMKDAPLLSIISCRGLCSTLPVIATLRSSVNERQRKSRSQHRGNAAKGRESKAVAHSPGPLYHHTSIKTRNEKVVSQGFF